MNIYQRLLSSLLLELVSVQKDGSESWLLFHPNEKSIFSLIRRTLTEDQLNQCFECATP
jgi:hypothetical protein